MKFSDSSLHTETKLLKSHRETKLNTYMPHTTLTQAILVAFIVLVTETPVSTMQLVATKSAVHFSWCQSIKFTCMMPSWYRRAIIWSSLPRASPQEPTTSRLRSEEGMSQLPEPSTEPLTCRSTVSACRCCCCDWQCQRATVQSYTCTLDSPEPDSHINRPRHHGGQRKKLYYFCSPERQ